MSSEQVLLFTFSFSHLCLAIRAQTKQLKQMIVHLVARSHLDPFDQRVDVALAGKLGRTTTALTDDVMLMAR